MRLSLIVAVSRNGVIGHRGGLPWRLSADLRRFKSITMGHTLIMGRKTFESIGRKLPGRESIVISRQASFQAKGCQIAADWTAARQLASQDREAFVIGGQEVYQLALPDVERMFWTRVEANVEGDTTFPKVDWNHWALVSDEPHPADEQNDFAVRFQVFQRKCPDSTPSKSGQ